MDNAPSPVQPIDLLVLLALVASGKPDMPVRDVADAIGISKSAVALSLRRLAGVGLLKGDGAARRINRVAVRSLLEHSLRWIAPGTIGNWELGLPTAHAAGVLSAGLVGDADPLVIPLHHGPMRGRAVTPIHPRAPQAAGKDPKLHNLLAIVDALRVGRARDREAALAQLRAFV